MGVIYVKEGQYTEEEILDNNDNSPLFEEFLQILGEKVRLKGFDKYKGGLDTVHDLTGFFLRAYTGWFRTCVGHFFKEWFLEYYLQKKCTMFVLFVLKNLLFC